MSEQSAEDFWEGAIYSLLREKDPKKGIKKPKLCVIMI